MKYKRYMDRVAACCFRLPESWKGTGKAVIGDSWFGSVNSLAELMNKKQ